MTKELNVDLRQSLVNFPKSGNNYSPISNWLAAPRSMVQSVLKKFQQFVIREDLPGFERKAKLSPRTAQNLSRECNIITEWFFFYINHFSLIIFYHSVWLGFELFGSKFRCIALGTVYARVQWIWQSQLSW